METLKIQILGKTGSHGGKTNTIRISQSVFAEIPSENNDVLFYMPLSH